ncbi:MAG: transcriptional regulator [Acidimicrobiales bacterium]
MAQPSDAHLLLLHVLRLRGTADAGSVASAAGMAPADAGTGLDDLHTAGLVQRRAGSQSEWSLTALGRKHHAALVAEELDACRCRPALEAVYRRFRQINPELLGACTAWQLRDVDGAQVVNDHADAAHDATVVARLRSVHERVRPLAGELGQRLDRFRPYLPRLQAALDRVVAGDGEWFTRPTLDSYHTVWFELHEDLLVTLGLDRAAEGRA